MDDRQDATANALGRILSRIREGERLLGAETDAGDEAAQDQERDVRRERAQDRKRAEQQQVELINEPAAEPVAQLALAGGADRHAEDGGAADEGELGGPGGEIGRQR